MIRAYDEVYLRNARSILANSLDYAVNTLGCETDEYYRMFLKSDLTDRFEKGDPFLIAGHSGIELALLVIEKNTGKSTYIPRTVVDGKSREYWSGWVIAFYQWYTACSLRRLEEAVPIKIILAMYDKYHEMDIMRFVERIDEMRKNHRVLTYLKELRQKQGLSQNELARLTDIPLKTLQHYEQESKSLAKANASYVLALANVLGCRPEELIAE